MNPKLRRVLAPLMDEFDLTILSHEQNKHHKLRLRQATTGRLLLLTVGVTLSDHRAMKNLRSDIRRQLT